MAKRHNHTQHKTNKRPAWILPHYVQAYEAEAKLSPLTDGTPAQVQYARFLRHKLLNQLEYVSALLNGEEFSEFYEWYQRIRGNKRCRFWLDHNRDTLHQLWRNVKEYEAIDKPKPSSAPAPKLAPPKVLPSQKNWRLAISKQAIGNTWL